MLKTGPREQELANLEWEHLDLGVRLTKPDRCLGLPRHLICH
jgi:hypothetical protein